MRLLNSNSSGSILVSMLITLPFLIMIAASYMSLSTNNYILGRRDQFRTHAQFAADAGADYAIEQLNQETDWDGTTSPVTVHNESNVKTEFEVQVSDTDADHKVITATGKTFSPASDTSEPDSSVTIKVNVRAVREGDFSIVTGVGGLFLSNSAKIVGGSVFVNGEITMTGSSQIGLSTNPVNVKVANQVCPIPANGSYPRLCIAGDNDDPISIANPAWIYGDVEANHQLNNASMSNGGLLSSSGVEEKELPFYDRDAQKAAVTTNLTGAQASCGQNQNMTWAANTKITGNVEINNNCLVTVEGNIWITGNLIVRNSAILQVSNTLGATMPNIMVDGSSGAHFMQSSQLKSNTSNTGFQVITYWSRASCSPDCANVDGTDLYNSRNDPTITLDHSAQGPNSILYAHWTQVLINNSGQIGALVGQTVSLKNSSTVTFGTSVAGTGDVTWIVEGYRRSF
jgi:hypothetical protein